jgi:uncharacterized protein (DUF58 family)
VNRKAGEQPSTEEPLFDTDFIRKLEYLNVIAKKVFAGLLRAERQTQKKGVSLEFSDYRNYTMGDDFRHIDWHVYARLEDFFIKLFREEENLVMNVFLDASLSMDYGRKNKLVHAKRLAAALAYIGMANMDSVSLFVFSDNLADNLRRLSGRGKIFALMSFLERLEPIGTTDIMRTMRAFTSQSRRRGLDIVISDFYDLDGHRPALKALKHIKHDVYVLQIVDALEESPELRGDLRLVDVEDREMKELTLTDRMMQRYQAAFVNHCDGLESFCRKNEFGYVKALTTVPFDKLVLTILRKEGLLA